MVVSPDEFGHEKAYDVMKYIIDHAWANRRTIYYKDIADNVLMSGSDGIDVRFPLGAIIEFLKLHGLPHLNELVVNKNTKRPGSWAFDDADSEAEQRWQRHIAEIYAFNWRRLKFRK